MPTFPNRGQRAAVEADKESFRASLAPQTASKDTHEQS
jgi:hypothetical protein